jgi:hypothetical protein
MIELIVFIIAAAIGGAIGALIYDKWFHRQLEGKKK